MIKDERRQIQNTHLQLQRELASKTELECYLQKAVDKVTKEKKKQMQKA